MSFAHFEYDEDTLIKILTSSSDNHFSFQITNKFTLGVSRDPKEQKDLDEGRKLANLLFHLSFAEDMGLMKLVVESTEKNPVVHDLNGEPICISRYQMTYRGMRYLKYSKCQRWLVRNYHEFMPIVAISGISIAWLSLLISIWIR